MSDKKLQNKLDPSTDFVWQAFTTWLGLETFMRALAQLEWTLYVKQKFCII